MKSIIFNSSKWKQIFHYKEVTQKSVPPLPKKYSLQYQLNVALSSPLVQRLWGKDFILSADVVDKVENGEPIQAHSLSWNVFPNCAVCDACHAVPSYLAEIKSSSFDAKYRLQRKLLFTENIWGVKIADKIIYNIHDYSLRGAANLALLLPCAEIYSDRVILYYRNGERVVAEDAVHLIFNDPSPYRDWRYLPIEKAHVLFPDCLSGNTRIYENQTVYLSPDCQRFILLSQLKNYKGGNIYLRSFEKLLQAQTNENFCTYWTSSLPLFAPQTTLRDAFLKVVEDSQKGIYCFDFSCNANQSQQVCVGYGDLTFQEAMTLAKDKEKICLQEIFSKNEKEKTFNFLHDGTFLDCTHRDYLLPLAHFVNWAKPFSKKELRAIFAEKNHLMIEYFSWRNFFAAKS